MGDTGRREEPKRKEQPGSKKEEQQSTGPKAKEYPGEKRSEIKATELLSEAATRRSAATLSGAGPAVAEGREQRGRGMKVEDTGAECRQFSEARQRGETLCGQMWV